MSSPDRPHFPRAAGGPPPCWRFVACAWLTLLCRSAGGSAPDRRSPPRLDRIKPGGGRGLPRPESREQEALRMALAFRHASEPRRPRAALSKDIQRIDPGPLPATAEGYDGIDHVLLASRRIADDPAGAQALRRWLQRGGR